MDELEAANERLTGRRDPKPKITDYSQVAKAAIERARASGALEEKQEKVNAWEAEQFEAKVQLYLRNFKRSLPHHYQSYTENMPPEHPGNQEARDVIEWFALGEALHLHGPAGVSKSHCAIWLAAQLIRQHAIGVRYYHVGDLIRAFRDFGNEPNLLGPQVLVVDDVDKGSITEHNRMTIWKVYERLEDAKTLITTANRDNFELAAYWFDDPQNAAALSSRMSLMREVEVTGEDYRPRLKGMR